MKAIVTWGLLAVAAVGLLTTGFQCSSAELTSARLYIQRKDFQNAEAQLKKEVEKNPKSEEGYFLLGQVRYELKDYKGMKDAFENASKVGQAHKKEIDNLTLSAWGRLFNQGVEEINKAENAEGFDKAIQTFTMASYLEPDSMINQRNLGLAFYRKSQYEKSALEQSIAPLTESFEKGKDVLSARILGSIYLNKAGEEKAKFTEANREMIEGMKKIENIREKMKAADVKYYLGQPTTVNKPAAPAAAKKGKKPAAASQKEEWVYDQYKLTVGVDGDVVTSVKFAEPYKPTIDSTMHRQAIADFSKAVEVYKKAQAMFPDDQEISENLMNAYIGAERNNEARTLLNERVQKYPNSKYDHYNLGVFLLKDGEFEGAVQQFQAAYSLDTTMTSALYNLAASYVNWGVSIAENLKKENEGKPEKEQKVSDAPKEKFRAAVPYLEKVVAEKTDDVQMLELLAQVYANLGQPDKAKAYYEKADAARQGKK
ncbi:MAG: tetratricopeptide repeat protein [Acidobacteriota bacterium]